MSNSKIRRHPNSVTQKPTLRYGDRLGDFVINGFAGKGATSFVYRARHEAELEPVAVKVLHPSLIHDEVKRGRFLREAQMMIQFDHPNIVFFHEVFDIDGQLAFVMEFIDGLQLDQWLAVHKDELDELTITCLFMDILRGLNHAHEHGVFHRDLKPANIMVAKQNDRWIAKIIDFGVARIADEPILAEDREKIVGTAAYISPEEIRDPETVCESSDIYSIGVMLYEALCGRRPFEGLPVPELMKAHVKLDPERPSTINPNISSPFEALLLRSLTKDPQDRFESAEDLINALESIARMVDPENPDIYRTPDPEANILTVEWNRPERARYDFLLAFRQLMLAAIAMVFARNQGEEMPHSRRKQRADTDLDLGARHLMDHVQKPDNSTDAEPQPVKPPAHM